MKIKQFDVPQFGLTLFEIFMVHGDDKKYSDVTFPLCDFCLVHTDIPVIRSEM
jgi:hypothetical protein